MNLRVRCLRTPVRVVRPAHHANFALGSHVREVTLGLTGLLKELFDEYLNKTYRRRDAQLKNSRRRRRVMESVADETGPFVDDISSRM